MAAPTGLAQFATPRASASAPRRPPVRCARRGGDDDAPVTVVGRFRITPADVGRRVSVRSGLTDAGAGRPAGPAATDSLGTLTGWPVPGDLTIARDRGPGSVTLRPDRVLAAKVVPPDTGVLTWQERSDRAWGSAPSRTFQDWSAHWRPGEDVRDRGLTVGADPGVDPAAALDSLLAFLSPRMPIRGPLLRAPRPCVHDPALAALGWRPGREILFMSVPVLPGRATPHGPRGGSAPLGGEVEFTEAAGRVCMTRVDRAAIMTGLLVDQAERRRGVGGRLTRTALTWAAEQGLAEVGLQVLADNEPACALYASLGFTVHHRSCYWHPPAPA